MMAVAALLLVVAAGCLGGDEAVPVALATPGTIVSNAGGQALALEDDQPRASTAAERCGWPEQPPTGGGATLAEPFADLTLPAGTCLESPQHDGAGRTAQLAVVPVDVGDDDGAEVHFAALWTLQEDLGAQLAAAGWEAAGPGTDAIPTHTLVRDGAELVVLYLGIENGGYGVLLTTGL